MDLLTQIDRDSIKLALTDVTDTFCKTPAVFKKKAIETPDRWGQSHDIQYIDTIVMCFVEYPYLQINDVRTYSAFQFRRWIETFYAYHHRRLPYFLFSIPV